MTAITDSDYPPYGTPEEKEAYHAQNWVVNELIDGTRDVFLNNDSNANEALNAATCNPSRGMAKLAAWRRSTAPASAMARRTLGDDANQGAVLAPR